ncbi:CHAT domain-containing protein [Actinocorallia sp. A-T 12471]|uniref:CHAT domain-containing protein n=1 Tax=Actinocorallia sp. A-T 12471 TaxID=3089813 RepID=UPI0029CB332D|nr:CHAT domain-containing protein [Actinocorallia sp. A-T 12471]MDX6739850.1 CHAT domain-containing protein [Actinocorallia sp. A-T 12471]
MIDALLAGALDAKETGDLAEGHRLLADALARCAGDVAATARVQAVMVALLTASGRTAEALVLADRAEPHLVGADLQRLSLHRSYARASQGKVDRPARPGTGDPVWRAARLMANGISLAQAGRFQAAESALKAAASLAARTGPRRLELMVRHNEAHLAALRGRFSRALGLFAECAPEFTGERRAQHRLDHASALLEAGLCGDARELLAETVETAARAGFAADAATALLARAEAELACGDAGRAADSAREAEDAFAVQARPGWEARAHGVLLRAQAARGERSPSLLVSVRTTAARLEAFGWTDPALRTRVEAALAFPAEPDLLPRPGSAASAALRLRAHRATAHVHCARGEEAEARRAVREALRTAAALAAGGDSVELRGVLGQACADLSPLAVRLARTDRELLGMEELRRSIVFPSPIRRPSMDGLSGRARALSTGGSTARPSVATADLLEGLHGVGLLELVRAEDRLLALVVRDGRIRRAVLGSYDAAVRETRLIRFALTRAMVDGSAPTAAVASLRSRFAPALGLLDGVELVIAPTGSLYGLPWTTVTDAPFTVVPSATAWLLAQERRPEPGPVVLLSGPGLQHAEAELAALRDVYPDAHTGTDPGLLCGARLAHVAAHGVHLADDPLSSYLDLKDGPLTGHDLNALAAPPSVVVMSACDAGLGDDVLGLPGVLMSAGVRTVIAAVTKLPDAAAPALMADLHHRLTTGESPTRALAALPHTPGRMGLQSFGAGS